MALYLIGKIPAGERAVFEQAITQIAGELGISDPQGPNWLMAIMDLESGLKPDIVNSIGCTGLIQFCPDMPGGSFKTIGGEKVSLGYLNSLSATQQLVYVRSYFRDIFNQYGTPKSFVDLYLMVFLPGALKFGYEQPIQVKSAAFMDSVKKNNPAFVDAGGNITKKQIESVYRKRYSGLFEAAKETVREVAERVETVREEEPGMFAVYVLLIAGGLIAISVTAIIITTSKTNKNEFS